MHRTSLHDYLRQPGNTQEALAKSLRLSQSAVSKMTRSGRNLFVVIDDAGGMRLHEEKIVAPECDNAS